MKPQNAAVVGLGIGMAHAAGYLTSPHARLAAVADAWDVRRATVGGTFTQGSMLNLKPLFSQEPLELSSLDGRWEDLGARVYSDVSEVAADPDISLVSLCTPDDTHEHYAIAVLEAGKNLLLEKPVALSLDSAERIRAAAERTGRRVAVGYEMRINPAVAKVRELVASGALGEIHAFSLQQYRKPFRRDKWQKWIQARERSGGLIVEETCHWFDLARFLTGKEIAHVHAVGTDRILPDFDYEDIAFVQGWYADGAVFQIGHSLTGFDFSLVIQVHGSAGTVWCGMKGDAHCLLDAGQTDYIALVAHGPVDGGAAISGASPREPEVRTYGTEAREGESIRDYVHHVAHAMHSGAPFLADLEDGIAALRIALAARASLHSGAVEVV